MNKKGQLLCAWSGILSMVVFFAGFWPMAHFMPPLSPAWTINPGATLTFQANFIRPPGGTEVIFSLFDKRFSIPVN